jgi:hypothetical protein
MREMIALPENLFTDHFVRTMLTDPLETDSLFERVYDILGYTLEDLVDLSMNPEGPDFESEDGLFLAGTFMMGIVMDRHFYTPFGYYLKLIKPHYVLPFDFENEMADFLSSNTTGEPEIFTAFYAPCSSYTLTDLGLRTFNMKPTEKNYYDVQQYMPFETLKDSLFSDPEKIGILMKMAQLLPPMNFDNPAPSQSVHTFRVRMQTEPNLWMHLHVPGEFTLTALYDEILYFFPLRENGDYSFFHDEIENRFTEYPSPKRAKPHNKKTADTTLNALDFERKNKMLLAAYNQSLPFAGKPSTLRLEMQMLGIKKADPSREYPYAARMSKSLKQYLEEEKT